MALTVSKCVIDTNVAITANIQPTLDDRASAECILACIQAIQDVKQGKKEIVIDNQGEIVAEYVRNLGFRGQPGVGCAFAKWIHDNQYNFPQENRVHITKVGNSYAEFPDHVALRKFDNNDRKFIAVSCAHLDRPPIFQAKDSKWWGYKKSLMDVGVRVEFLCPKYVREKFIKKFGKNIVEA